MIPSKINRRPTPTLFPESPQQKKPNNLQQVSKTSSIPQQFTKMKTNTDLVRHSKNNSMVIISEKIKTTDSIQHFPKNEDNSLKMELKLKTQIISDLTKTLQTTEQQNNQQKEIISSLEKDIETLNKTIEKMCAQMSQQQEEFQASLFEFEKQLKKKENQLMQSKSENTQLLTIIKQGTYKNGKENTHIPTTQQEQVKKLKTQIEQQKVQFNKKEEELNRQIQGLNQFLNELIQTQTSDSRTQNYVNSSSRGSKDTIHRKQSLQHEMETFTQKLERIEKEKQRCDERMQSMQNTINTLTEKQLMATDNSDNYKEIIKLKQVVQIQKKQIEFQQKTILNQHFEIQNLQTLLYKVDQDSVCEEKQNLKLELGIHTNAFTASPKEEVYHLNDSQSDIKPRYFFESQQNTFQKYQVITEESTFRN